RNCDRLKRWWQYQRHGTDTRHLEEARLHGVRRGHRQRPADDGLATQHHRQDEAEGRLTGTTNIWFQTSGSGTDDRGGTSRVDSRSIRVVGHSRHKRPKFTNRRYPTPTPPAWARHRRSAASASLEPRSRIYDALLFGPRPP